MSYETNLNQQVYDSQTKKYIPAERARLKAQLDDFATFQWRGHNMFDDFGCFIINDKNGSLKFYNGPGFTNQYAKAQFSSANNALLGIEFKQQTIPMKVGLYWFTMEEYQEFLYCIDPYQINYITFDFDKKYGYLVKSGKIADSTKYIVGTDSNGTKRYYTELDLTWEVLGDACARSNLAYEYIAETSTNTETKISICEWKLDSNAKDMTDASLLDTPLIFELPCRFNNKEASLKLEAIAPTTNQTTTLFDIQLQNITTTPLLSSGFLPYYITPTTGLENVLKTKAEDDSKNIRYHFTSKGIYDSTDIHGIDAYIGVDTYGAIEVSFAGGEGYYDYKQDEENIVITLKDSVMTPNIAINGALYKQSGSILDVGEVDLDRGIVTFFVDKLQAGDELTIAIELYLKADELDVTTMYDFKCTYNEVDYTHMFYVTSTTEETDILKPSHIAFYNKNSEDSCVVTTAVNNYYPDKFLIYAKTQECSELVVSVSEMSLYSDLAVWPDLIPIYQNYIRYDSETGLMYIQEGSNSTWHLINYQYTPDGDPFIKSYNAKMWKIPGKFSNKEQPTNEWCFKLTGKNIDLSAVASAQLNQAITVYSRKNIV